MADLLEFWKQKGVVYVEYNSKCYTFSNFLKTAEGNSIINIMYQKILSSYINKIDDKNQNKAVVVRKFIKNHFLKKDKIFDVIIYNDGKVVKFNLEE
jgi:hypothetical protein